VSNPISSDFLSANSSVLAYKLYFLFFLQVFSKKNFNFQRIF